MLKVYKSSRFPLLIGIILISSFWQLGSWGVTETSEARYAEISREMLRSGDMLLPRYLGILHFDKPPMTYWITILGYKIWGINAFGARFFLQIAFAVQLILVYQIAKILFGSRRTAIYSLICYAAMPLTITSVRNLTTDAYLNTFALASLYLYVLFSKSNNIAALYGFFLALAIAIFTKGPFALILPLLAIFPVNGMIKSPISPRKKGLLLHMLAGGALVLVLGGWWFFYLMWTSREFYYFFIGDQIINRLAHAGELSRSKPFWYYIALLPLFILPISGPVIYWLRNVKKTPRNVNILGIFTLAVPIVLFSCSSSKLTLYILPIAPYLALCAGYQLDQMTANALKKAFIGNVVFYGMLILAITAVCFGFVKQLGVGMNLQMIIFILVLTGYFIYTLTARIELKAKYLLQLLIIPAIVLPLSTNILRQIDPVINSTKPVAAFIRANAPNCKVLVWNRALNSVAFNLQKQIYSLKFNHYSLARTTQFQHNRDWKQILIDVNNADQQSYLKKLISDNSVLVRYKRDEIPATLEWIVQAFRAKKDFGKYIVYYK